MQLPFDRFLNLTYFWATQHGDEKEVAKFDANLSRPPVRAMASERARKAINSSGPWSPEAEAASLSGLAAALGQGVAGAINR